MHKILLGTHNLGKIAELIALLDGLPVEIETPTSLRLAIQVAEEGSTYAENATRKARAFSSAAGLVALADDSGLEVDALGGAPGLHSARYSPRPGATDADRRYRLLQVLRDFEPPWSARFHSVIAVTTPDGRGFTAEGVCEGIIVPDERGDFGFGYDPIFLLPELGLTMAQLPLEVKNQVSHRARAVMAARPKLLALLVDLQ